MHIKNYNYFIIQQQTQAYIIKPSLRLLYIKRIYNPNIILIIAQCFDKSNQYHKARNRNWKIKYKVHDVKGMNNKT